MKTIKNFFKEMFKDNIGVYHPEANKPTLKWTIYFVVGLILSYVIPTCLVYLEAWQFNWNVFAIIWEKGTNYVYRAYFIFFFGGNLGIVLLGYLNTYHVNGNAKVLAAKIVLRFILYIYFAIGVASYIIANIIY
jgi:hypothetical protein